MPVVLLGIYKKNTFNIGILVFFIGILSFLYVPTFSNDRVRYYELYEIIQRYSFKEFIIYLGIIRMPDFIFHTLIFITSKMGINIQFLFLGITTFTFGSFFFLFNKLFDKNSLSNKIYFLGFLLFLFSFSYYHSISGMRQYFGISFFLLAAYNLLIENKTTKSITLLLLAIFTHFSLLLFIPALFILKIYPNKHKIYRTIFVFSFLFLFIPKSLILDIFNYTNFLSEAYNTKADAYLNGDDFIERGIKGGSSNYYLMHLFSISWVYYAYIYLLLTIKRNSIIRNWLYLFFGLTNMFYVISTVYWRYLFLLSILFAFLILTELNNKRIKPALLTLSFFFISILTQIIIARYNIIESYFDKHILSIFFVFFKHIQPNDFL